MKTIRTIITATSVLVCAALLLSIAHSVPGLKQAMDGLKVNIQVPCYEVKFVSKCESTATTVPQWDSGHPKVNQYGVADPDGTYSIQPGTQPGMKILIPAIP